MTQVLGGPKFGALLPGQEVNSSMKILKDIADGEPSTLHSNPCTRDSMPYTYFQPEIVENS